MSKEKYYIGTAVTGDISGRLDVDENGEICIFVEEKKHPINEIIRTAIGGEISLKFNKPVSTNEVENG